MPSSILTCDSVQTEANNGVSFTKVGDSHFFIAAERCGRANVMRSLLVAWLVLHIEILGS